MNANQLLTYRLKLGWGLILLLVGGIFGYGLAIRMQPSPNAFDFELSGEIKIDFPQAHARTGILANGLDTPVYVYGIVDASGQAAEISELMVAMSVEKYYMPSNLRIHLHDLDDVSSALLLAGDSLSFSFENMPEEKLQVRYVVLNAGLRITEELVHALGNQNP